MEVDNILSEHDATGSCRGGDICRGDSMNGLFVAANELKEPLVTLRQLALALGDESDKNLKNKMVTVADRAIRQMNDLAKMKRLEDGLFEMEPVAVRAVCDDVIREVEKLFKNGKFRLAVKYTNRSRTVSANREILYSVVYNFLVGAIHYSNEDTKSVVSIRDNKGAVRVSVRDYGPALPSDIWRTMKRGFISEPSSVAMRPGSFGLGLYIASKFSQYMHANVGAVQHKDGVSFYVELPISRQMSLLES